MNEGDIIQLARLATIGTVVQKVLVTDGHLVEIPLGAKGTLRRYDHSTDTWLVYFPRFGDEIWLNAYCLAHSGNLLPDMGNVEALDAWLRSTL